MFFLSHKSTEGACYLFDVAMASDKGFDMSCCFVEKTFILL